jgi:hypothetical protein
MGSAGLVDLFFKPKAGANCLFRRTRSMLVAVCQHSRVWPGAEVNGITLGSCGSRFGLPVVMQTTFGSFGMSEHRLMHQAESQSE